MGWLNYSKCTTNKICKQWRSCEVDNSCHVSQSLFLRIDINFKNLLQRWDPRPHEKASISRLSDWTEQRNFLFTLCLNSLPPSLPSQAHMEGVTGLAGVECPPRPAAPTLHQEGGSEKNGAHQRRVKWRPSTHVGLNNLWYISISACCDRQETPSTHRETYIHTDPIHY